MTEDDDIDDYQPPPQLPVYEQVIKELGSAYKSSSGALKELTGLTLVESISNPALKEITAKIAIGNYQESPGGEYSASGERVFDLGLPDIRRLADTAPEYRSSFVLMARQLDEKLQKDIAADKRNILTWCDQGLPTNQPTAVMRPLRLKMGT